MAEHLDREHYIPIRVSDLIDFFTEGKGAKVETPPLPRREAEEFHRFALLVTQYYHLFFNAQLQRMKDAFAPFDPDAETVSLDPLPAEQRKQAIERLFRDTHSILERANYEHLTRREVEQVMQGASAWGLEMDVTWDVFEYVEVYYRGDTIGKRIRRRWWKLWRREELDVPEFNRLILILKLTPHKRLRKHTDTDNVFIKLFKDMPKNDLEMVLPGTRVRLSRIDKGLIFYPLAMGCTIVVYAILNSIFDFKNFLTGFFSSVALTWSLAVGFAGYAYRSYHAYTVKKTAYSLQLTESLYFQSLGSNAGVFFRIFDEAEEQETREVLLAYFYLWRHGGEKGMTVAELDDLIEKDIERKLKLKVDFEIADAISKLEQHSLIERNDTRIQAIPLEQAILKMRDATTRISNEAATPNRQLATQLDSRPDKESDLMNRIELKPHDDRSE